ncbi:protein trichome birefringence-like 13 [Dendrobium catenatum]|uniref:protein trichome birefringence-like 13 n=1 Tax=Dendrobium catenatum TaxID=906689 RepID=UPI0009F46FF6|nr:protein trichome birefringence-like 13 [Dendrobium catenatum]
MAALDTGARRHPSSFLTCFALLLFIATLFLFSALRRSFSPEGLSVGVQPSALRRDVPGEDYCDYSNGNWIRDQSSVIPRYDNSCKEIFKGWNCISSGKSNARELLQWRWKPLGCDLLPLDPVHFLRRFRNKSIGFVGDSLNRNMFVSLFCMLRKVYVGEVRKWRPAGADRGFTFVRNNLTVAYHRTNLLARYGSWSASSNGGALESFGFKQGYRVDVDVPEHTWAEALPFHDIIIFNTGHWWWSPSKFDPIWSPMLFFEKGMPVLPTISPDVGISITLKHMISYIEKRMKSDGIKFFLTLSPRHFEGGEWNQGGSCRRVQPLGIKEVEDLFSLEKNGTNVEVRLVNQHLMKALKGSSFHILNITHMSEFRADAHPSITGGKKHEDCMHWCLPGLTDSWIDLLISLLENLKS